MINKIDTRSSFDIHNSLRVDPLSRMKTPDFDSLLGANLDCVKPLEIIVIHLLNRVLDTLLSADDPSMREDSFFLPPFPFNCPEIPPQPQPLPAPVIDSPQLEMSKNLQESPGWEAAVEEASKLYKVEPALIRAVIQVESSGNPLAVSPAGAQGLMQLMPATAAELGVKDAFDPEQNIMAGTCYLRQLLDRYHGDVRLALAAYNWGMGNLERKPHSMPRETRNYIVKVENLYHSRMQTRQTL